jgi:hypothetical protein
LTHAAVDETDPSTTKLVASATSVSFLPYLTLDRIGLASSVRLAVYTAANVGVSHFFLLPCRAELVLDGPR